MSVTKRRYRRPSDENLPKYLRNDAKRARAFPAPAWAERMEQAADCIERLLRRAR